MAKQTAANAKGKSGKGKGGFEPPSGARGAPQNIPGKAGAPKPPAKEKPTAEK